ncbi:hypothetical protein GIY30_02575 [Gordonia sp. HNM0687]|uniref:Right handed beta helix domain-containing protein n=1 Tax=Gordonia mangrovi TaxID=2665643 RepID=A0A6L7GK00_9ACTN|nr:right-handed parallel beta-helix repeat-containing protein [Gordonia mangrovi]MXP20249.1 hypothetical protein [Gordonia mangrovi]UVF79143.1 hypothetical protein NWF22_04650 [Gordonia mangrovi]
MSPTGQLARAKVTHTAGTHFDASAWLYVTLTLEDFGAVGDGLADDTEAINRALVSAYPVLGNQSATYRVTSEIKMKNGSDVDFQGAIIRPDFAAQPQALSVILIAGASSAESSASNCRIENCKIIATNQKNVKFGIEVYGATTAAKPANILIRGVVTKNCDKGGIFLNTCTAIRIVDCINDGGNRAIGVGATKSHSDTTDVLVQGCSSKNSLSFCFQTYYGSAIQLVGNVGDGSKQRSADFSIITVDRSRDVSVMANSCTNSPEAQIYVTGASGVNVTGNIVSGGAHGIHVCCNFEAEEDAAIREARNISVTGNITSSHAVSDVLINGVQQAVVSANAMRGTACSLRVQDTIRRQDSMQMNTRDFSAVGNVGSAEFQASIESPSAAPSTIALAANRFTGWTGWDRRFSGLDVINTEYRLGGNQLTQIGAIKYDDVAGPSAIREFRFADETANHGFVEQVDSGRINYINAETSKSLLTMHISNSDGARGIEVLPNGGGIYLHSPDGTRFKVSVANDGEIKVARSTS